MDLYRDGEGKKESGGRRKRQNSPENPSLPHPYPKQCKGQMSWGRTGQRSRWEKGRLKISVILRMDSVSKTRLRQEKEKEKNFRMPKTADPHLHDSAACRKSGGPCCGIWLGGGHCPIGRHLHGGTSPLWSSTAGPGDERGPQGERLCYQEWCLFQSRELYS